MSGSNLRRRKLRTFLTILGVIIGTASVVAMLSLGLGMQRSMYQDIENYGSLTTLSIFPGEGGDEKTSKSDFQYITDDTILELAAFDHVKSVAPVYQSDAIFIKGKYEVYSTLFATTQEGFRALNLDLKWGELPPDQASHLNLIFGNTVIADFYDTKSDATPYYDDGELVVDLQKDSLFMILDPENYARPFYQAVDDEPILDRYNSNSDEPSPEIQIKAKKYAVKADGELKGGPEAWSTNSYYVFCNLDSLRNMLKKEYKNRPLPGQPTTQSGKPLKEFAYTYAQVKVDDIKNVESLSKTYRDMGYEVQSEAEWVAQMKNEMRVIQMVLGGIGAVSLLVAAIGIANTMMMAIYERTKEIGVMKVIGCSLKNIKQMFLIESAFIGLIGGIIGNIISFGISAIINAVTGDMMGTGSTLGISYIPPWLVLLALGIATFVGVASGFFPALRAMRLSPLAAIRNE
jgi:ABC-type antimicrobial peptide transport system permease subunit